MESSYSQINLKDYIKSNEGLELRSYPDREGFAVGYGHSLPDSTPVTITLETANEWLTQDIYSCTVKLNKYYPWWTNRTRESQIVMVDMCYQLGYSGLSKFKWFIKALWLEMYTEAGEELLDSLYATQTPGRARRNRDLLNSTRRTHKWKSIIR